MIFNLKFQTNAGQTRVVNQKIFVLFKSHFIRFWNYDNININYMYKTLTLNVIQHI